MMTFAEMVAKQAEALDLTWNETKNPMAVMRLHILQSIEEIDRKGYERLGEEAADFDAPELVRPQLTKEEQEAKEKLAAALELITRTWETVCSIEDEFC